MNEKRHVNDEVNPMLELSEKDLKKLMVKMPQKTIINYIELMKKQKVSVKKQVIKTKKNPSQL